jgi:NADH:ubiquinone oxidoreductase subunit 5 (subunit L)/multisubunit Na+/H+ antiporter MnhA subunit
MAYSDEARREGAARHVAGAILLARAPPLLPPNVLLVGAVSGTTAVSGRLMGVAHGGRKRLLAASTSS